MAKGILTNREVKNKVTGVDIYVSDYQEVPHRLRNDYLYHVIVVSNLFYYKKREHRESDVVQFMVSKTFNEFEELYKRLYKRFPSVNFPPLPAKSLFSQNPSGQLECMDKVLKLVASTVKLSSSPMVISFLRGDPLPKELPDPDPEPEKPPHQPSIPPSTENKQPSTEKKAGDFQDVDLFDGSKQHSVPAPASTAFVEEDEICVEHIVQVESAGISIFDEDPSEAKNVDDDDLFRKTTSNSDETYDLDAELNMFGSSDEEDELMTLSKTSEKQSSIKVVKNVQKKTTSYKRVPTTATLNEDDGGDDMFTKASKTKSLWGDENHQSIDDIFGAKKKSIFDDDDDDDIFLSSVRANKTKAAKKVEDMVVDDIQQYINQNENNSASKGVEIEGHHKSESAPHTSADAPNSSVEHISEDVSCRVTDTETVTDVITGNVTDDVTTENVTDVANNITDDITQNFIDDITENFTDEVSENITDEVSENITDDITENVTDDITENVTDDVAKNITDDITENVTADVAKNVTYDISENVTDVITENVIDDVAKNVKDNITENATDNNTEKDTENAPETVPNDAITEMTESFTDVDTRNIANDFPEIVEEAALEKSSNNAPVNVVSTEEGSYEDTCNENVPLETNVHVNVFSSGSHEVALEEKRPDQLTTVVVSEIDNELLNENNVKSAEKEAELFFDEQSESVKQVTNDDGVSTPESHETFGSTEEQVTVTNRLTDHIAADGNSAGPTLDEAGQEITDDCLQTEYDEEFPSETPEMTSFSPSSSSIDNSNLTFETELGSDISRSEVNESNVTTEAEPNISDISQPSLLNNSSLGAVSLSSLSSEKNSEGEGELETSTAGEHDNSLSDKQLDYLSEEEKSSELDFVEN